MSPATVSEKADLPMPPEGAMHRTEPATACRDRRGWMVQEDDGKMRKQVEKIEEVERGSL